MSFPLLIFVYDYQTPLGLPRVVPDQSLEASAAGRSPPWRLCLFLRLLLIYHLLLPLHYSPPCLTQPVLRCSRLLLLLLPLLSHLSSLFPYRLVVPVLISLNLLPLPLPRPLLILFLLPRFLWIWTPVLYLPRTLLPHLPPFRVLFPTDHVCSSVEYSWFLCPSTGSSPTHFLLCLHGPLPSGNISYQPAHPYSSLVFFFSSPHSTSSSTILLHQSVASIPLSIPTTLPCTVLHIYLPVLLTSSLNPLPFPSLPSCPFSVPLKGNVFFMFFHY